MSLLHLVHKNVVIKFSDAAETPFNTVESYAFRLTGVDGMGFLQIQQLSVTGTHAPEAVSEAYWINKDLVRELHELDLIEDKSKIVYTGKAAAPAPVVAAAPVEPVVREVTPKLPKAKKSVLKQKPVFN